MRKKAYEFQMIETDEWITIDPSIVIAVKEETKEMMHDRKIPGVNLITQFGASLWIKGEYAKVRNLFFRPNQVL